MRERWTREWKLAFRAKLRTLARAENDLYLHKLRPSGDLTDEEVEGLEAALKGLEATHACSLPSLLEQWNRFQTALDKAYTGDLDDYENELTTRALLQSIMETVPERVRGKLEEEVRRDDEHFREATRPISGDRALYDVKRPPSVVLSDEALQLFAYQRERWWYHRVPKHLDECAAHDQKWQRA